MNSSKSASFCVLQKSDSNTFSGWSVSLNSDGSKLAVGAPFNGAGNTRVFTSTTLSANDFQLNGKEITLYPNPSNSMFQLETELQIENVELYSLQGQLVKTFEKNVCLKDVL